MIIPSIDLLNGKSVQLVNGNLNQRKVEVDDPISLARTFNLFGEVAVIDLDSALSKGNNEDLIEQLCTIADCRVGGGIRTVEKGDKILRAGAKKIIIGTRAEPDFLSSFNKDRIIVAIDMKDGRVATDGWKKVESETPMERARLLQDYCSEFLFTDISKEGRLEGINLEMARFLNQNLANQLTYAGGITSVEDIIQLEREGINSQVGMAIYTKRLSLEEAFLSAIDFRKGNGLVPTIVEEESTGEVLMMAYSDIDSLRKSFDQINGKRFAHYYSRSRRTIWKKGETSGNVQELVKVKYDCDADTLLFRVKQKGNACHTGSRSCFKNTEFSLKQLEKVILERKEQNSLSQSYTRNLLDQKGLIENKLVEELTELINHTDKSNLIWEAADLVYFLLTYLVREGVSLKQVENELWRRNRS